MNAYSLDDVKIQLKRLGVNIDGIPDSLLLDLVNRMAEENHISIKSQSSSDEDDEIPNNEYLASTSKNRARLASVGDDDESFEMYFSKPQRLSQPQCFSKGRPSAPTPQRARRDGAENIHTCIHRPYSANTYQSSQLLSDSIIQPLSYSQSPKKVATRTKSRGFLKSRPKTRHQKPLSDPVSRYHSYANGWKKDPFLSGQDSSRKNLSSFFPAAPKPIQKHKPSVNEYVVPTSKRRDDVRWNTRTRMVMGGSEY